MIIIRVRQICRQGGFLMLIDMHNYIEIRDRTTTLYINTIDSRWSATNVRCYRLRIRTYRRTLMLSLNHIHG